MTAAELAALKARFAARQRWRAVRSWLLAAVAVIVGMSMTLVISACAGWL